MFTVLAFTLSVLLAQAPPSVQAQSTGVLSGRLVEEGTNAPIPNAQVTLTMAARPPSPGMPPRMINAVTDAEGRFAFTNLEPGRYMLNATKNGFAVQQGPGLSPAPIEIAAGKTVTVERALQRSAVIVGRLTNAEGEPIADVRVTALRRVMNADRLFPIGAGAQTNDLGEFRIFGLPTGEYFVQAAPRPPTPFAGSATPRGSTYAPTYYPGVVESASAQPIVLVPGQTSDPIVITLQLVAAFQLSGVVVDEAGAPVDGAMVWVMPDVSPAPVFGPPTSARTDSAGRFTAANLQAGRYQVTAAFPVVLDRQAGGLNGTSGGVGAVSGGFTTFSTGTSVGVGGGGVATESRGGTTTQFRMDDANRVTIDLRGDVSGLQVVARRPN